VPAVAAAWAVIDVGERGVEVSVGLDQIGLAVCSEVGIHVVHVYTVAQDVIWENVATSRVLGAARVAR